MNYNHHLQLGWNFWVNPYWNAVATQNAYYYYQNAKAALWTQNQSIMVRKGTGSRKKPHSNGPLLALQAPAPREAAGEPDIQSGATLETDPDACPVCGIVFNPGTNRSVQESGCRHVKCRTCFINQIAGCDQCKRETEPPRKILRSGSSTGVSGNLSKTNGVSKSIPAAPPRNDSRLRSTGSTLNLPVRNGPHAQFSRPILTATDSSPITIDLCKIQQLTTPNLPSVYSNEFSTFSTDSSFPEDFLVTDGSNLLSSNYTLSNDDHEFFLETEESCQPASSSKSSHFGDVLPRGRQDPDPVFGLGTGRTNGYLTRAQLNDGEQEEGEDVSGRRRSTSRTTEPVKRKSSAITPNRESKVLRTGAGGSVSQPDSNHTQRSDASTSQFIKLEVVTGSSSTSRSGRFFRQGPEEREVKKNSAIASTKLNNSTGKKGGRAPEPKKNVIPAGSSIPVIIGALPGPSHSISNGRLTDGHSSRSPSLQPSSGSGHAATPAPNHVRNNRAPTPVTSPLIVSHVLPRARATYGKPSGDTRPRNAATETATFQPSPQVGTTPSIHPRPSVSSAVGTARLSTSVISLNGGRTASSSASSSTSPVVESVSADAENIPQEPVQNGIVVLGKKKRNPVLIHAHISTLTGEPLLYQCNVCKKKFKTKAHIKYHEFCQNGEKPFKCEQCGQGFIAKSHYEYHIRTHTGERPYVCPKCGKGFNQRGKVTRHMRSHTGEKPFVCQQCGRGFANAQAMRSHFLIHTGERPFACEYCDKRFTGMTNLKKHVITHTGERPFMCTHCGKSFGLKWTLDLHLRTHSSERPYACDQCSRAFSNSKDLRRHMVIHSGERPFKCWICGTAFRRKDNLDRHIKNTHNQPKEVAKQLANEAAAQYLASTKTSPASTSTSVSTTASPEPKVKLSTKTPVPSTSKSVSPSKGGSATRQASSNKPTSTRVLILNKQSSTRSTSSSASTSATHAIEAKRATSSKATVLQKNSILKSKASASKTNGGPGTSASKSISRIGRTSSSTPVTERDPETPGRSFLNKSQRPASNAVIITAELSPASSPVSSHHDTDHTEDYLPSIHESDLRNEIEASEFANPEPKEEVGASPLHVVETYTTLSTTPVSDYPKLDQVKFSEKSEMEDLIVFPPMPLPECRNAELKKLSEKSETDDLDKTAVEPVEIVNESGEEEGVLPNQDVERSLTPPAKVCSAGDMTCEPEKEQKPYDSQSDNVTIIYGDQGRTSFIHENSQFPDTCDISDDDATSILDIPKEALFGFNFLKDEEFPVEVEIEPTMDLGLTADLCLTVKFQQKSVVKNGPKDHFEDNQMRQIDEKESSVTAVESPTVIKMEENSFEESQGRPSDEEAVTLTCLPSPQPVKTEESVEENQMRPADKGESPLPTVRTPSPLVQPEEGAEDRKTPVLDEHESSLSATQSPSSGGDAEEPVENTDVDTEEHIEESEALLIRAEGAPPSTALQSPMHPVSEDQSKDEESPIPVEDTDESAVSSQALPMDPDSPRSTVRTLSPFIQPVESFDQSPIRTRATEDQSKDEEGQTGPVDDKEALLSACVHSPSIETKEPVEESHTQSNFERESPLSAGQSPIPVGDTDENAYCSQTNCHLRTARTGDQSPLRAVVSDDQSPVRAVDSEERSPLRTVGSEEPSPLRTVGSEEPSPLRTMGSEEQSQLRTVGSEDQSHLRTVASEEQSPNQTVVNEEQTPIQTLATEEQSPIQTLMPEEQSPIQTLIPEEQSPIQTLIPEEQSPIQTLIPEEQSPIQTLIPEEQSTLQTVLTEDHSEDEDGQIGQADEEESLLLACVQSPSIGDEAQEPIEESKTPPKCEPETPLSAGQIPITVENTDKNVVFSQALPMDVTSQQSPVSTVRTPSPLVQASHSLDQCPIQTVVSEDLSPIQALGTEDQIPLQTMIAEDHSSDEDDETRQADDESMLLAGVHSPSIRDETEEPVKDSKSPPKFEQETPLSAAQSPIRVEDTDVNTVFSQALSINEEESPLSAVQSPFIGDEAEKTVEESQIEPKCAGETPLSTLQSPVPVEDTDENVNFTQALPMDQECSRSSLRTPSPLVRPIDSLDQCRILTVVSEDQSPLLTVVTEDQSPLLTVVTEDQSEHEDGQTWQVNDEELAGAISPSIGDEAQEPAAESQSQPKCEGETRLSAVHSPIPVEHTGENEVFSQAMPIDKESPLSTVRTPSPVVSEDQSPSRTVESEEQSPFRTMDSEEQSPFRTVDSEEQSPFRTVDTEELSHLRTAGTEGQSPLRTVGSEEQSRFRTVETEELSHLRTAGTEGQSPFRTVDSEEQSPVHTVYSEEQSPLRTVDTKDQSPTQNVVTEHQSPNQTVVTEHQSPIQTVDSEEQSPFRTVDTEELSHLRTAGTEGQSSFRAVDSEGQSPVQTVDSEEQSPLRTVDTKDQSPTQTVVTEHQSLTQTVVTEHQSPIQTVVAEDHLQGPSDDEELPVSATSQSPSIGVEAEYPVENTDVGTQEHIEESEALIQDDQCSPPSSTLQSPTGTVDSVPSPQADKTEEPVEENQTESADQGESPLPTVRTPSPLVQPEEDAENRRTPVLDEHDSSLSATQSPSSGYDAEEPVESTDVDTEEHIEESEALLMDAEGSPLSSDLKSLTRTMVAEEHSEDEEGQTVPISDNEELLSACVYSPSIGVEAEEPVEKIQTRPKGEGDSPLSAGKSPIPVEDTDESAVSSQALQMDPDSPRSTVRTPSTLIQPVESFDQSPILTLATEEQSTLQTLVTEAQSSIRTLATEDHSEDEDGQTGQSDDEDSLLSAGVHSPSIGDETVEDSKTQAKFEQETPLSAAQSPIRVEDTDENAVFSQTLSMNEEESPLSAVQSPPSNVRDEEPVVDNERRLIEAVQSQEDTETWLKEQDLSQLSPAGQSPTQNWSMDEEESPHSVSVQNGTCENSLPRSPEMASQAYPMPIDDHAHYVQSSYVQSRDSISEVRFVYAIPADQEFNQPTIPGMENSNVRVVYAAAAAQAEESDEEAGTPRKVRLLYAEALGYGGNSSDPLQLVYAATTPNQCLTAQDPVVEAIQPRYLPTPAEWNFNGSRAQAMFSQQPPTYQAPMHVYTGSSGTAISQSFAEYPENLSLMTHASNLGHLMPENHRKRHREVYDVFAQHGSRSVPIGDVHHGSRYGALSQHNEGISLLASAAAYRTAEEKAAFSIDAAERARISAAQAIAAVGEAARFQRQREYLERQSAIPSPSSDTTMSPEPEANDCSKYHRGPRKQYLSRPGSWKD